MKDNFIVVISPRSGVVDCCSQSVNCSAVAMVAPISDMIYVDVVHAVMSLFMMLLCLLWMEYGRRTDTNIWSAIFLPSRSLSSRVGTEELLH
eukprot:scaffold4570_cov96-Skeletonema_dohrnii-CCMP3373.AAC.2